MRSCNAGGAGVARDFAAVAVAAGVLLSGACAASPGSNPSRAAIERQAASTSAAAPTATAVPEPQLAEPTRETELADLTLEGALVLALETHPDLEVTRAALAAASVRERASGRLANPSLVTGFENAPFAGDTFENAEFLLGVSQSIPLSSRRSREKELAEQVRLGAAHAAGARLLELRRDVTSAFATALYAQLVEGLFANLVDANSQGYAVLQARFEAGDVIAQDLAQAELALAQAERDQQRSLSLARRAFAELAIALGDPGCEIQSVSGELSSSFELPAIAAFAQRLDEQPQLLAAQSSILAAETRVELARAARIPDLRLDLLYRRQGATDTDAFDLLVGAPLPLFRSGRPEVEEARHLLARARAAERSTRNTAEAQMRLAHLTISRALAELRFQEQEVLPRAAALLEVARTRYELGDTSLLEALFARQQWLEVQLDVLQTQRDVMQAWAVLAPYLRTTGE